MVAGSGPFADSSAIAHARSAVQFNWILSGLLPATLPRIDAPLAGAVQIESLTLLSHTGEIRFPAILRLG